MIISNKIQITLFLTTFFGCNLLHGMEQLSNFKEVKVKAAEVIAGQSQLETKAKHDAEAELNGKEVGKLIKMMNVPPRGMRGEFFKSYKEEDTLEITIYSVYSINKSFVQNWTTCMCTLTKKMAELNAIYETYQAQLALNNKQASNIALSQLKKLHQNKEEVNRPHLFYGLEDAFHYDASQLLSHSASSHSSFNCFQENYTIIAQDIDKKFNTLLALSKKYRKKLHAHTHGIWSAVMLFKEGNKQFSYLGASQELQEMEQSIKKFRRKLHTTKIPVKFDAPEFLAYEQELATHMDTAESLEDYNTSVIFTEDNDDSDSEYDFVTDQAEMKRLEERINSSARNSTLSALTSYFRLS